MGEVLLEYLPYVDSPVDDKETGCIEEFHPTTALAIERAQYLVAKNWIEYANVYKGNRFNLVFAWNDKEGNVD